MLRMSYRKLLAAALALFAPFCSHAVEDSELAKLWTEGTLRVPYRLIKTPGREHDEKLPLIVFLHGDWQDGTDNESQLAGYGNGSMELIDTALRNHGPLVYVAPQTTEAYWTPAHVNAVVAEWPRQLPLN